MKAQDITPESLAKALRTMRLNAKLTQLALSERTRELATPLKSVFPSQISDFERGRKRPSTLNLLSLLVACSTDGATLEFSLLQNAFETASRPEEERCESPLDRVWDALT